MSDMVQKLEQEIGDPLKNKAQCNLEWFRKNILNSWIRELEHDAHGPTRIEIDRMIEKKTEVWKRIRPLKGGDWMFEKEGSWPTAI